MKTLMKQVETEGIEAGRNRRNLQVVSERN